MIELSEETVKIIKRVSKADPFAELTFRRHYMGRTDERTSALLSWSETDRAGERHRLTSEVWSADGGHISAHDYRSDKPARDEPAPRVSHLYGTIRSEYFGPFARTLRAGDSVSVVVSLVDGHEWTDVELSRTLKATGSNVYGRRVTPYRAITETSRAGQHLITSNVDYRSNAS